MIAFHRIQYLILIIFLGSIIIVTTLFGQSQNDSSKVANSFDTTAINEYLVHQSANPCNTMILNLLMFRKLSDTTRGHGQNYPNPFCCSLLFDVVNVKDSVTLEIFDVKGLKVFTKHFGFIQHGLYILDDQDIPCNGTSFVHLKVGNDEPIVRQILRY